MRVGLEDNIHNLPPKHSLRSPWVVGLDSSKTEKKLVKQRERDVTRR